mgnify:CR=1 FL=1
MDNFIKGDLLNSWISFYQPEVEESDFEENTVFRMRVLFLNLTDFFSFIALSTLLLF